jgi:hypothetical protein
MFFPAGASFMVEGQEIFLPPIDKPSRVTVQAPEFTGFWGILGEFATVW